MIIGRIKLHLTQSIKQCVSTTGNTDNADNVECFLAGLPLMR